MPALVAGIHALRCGKKGVDGRTKSGHDVMGEAKKIVMLGLDPSIHLAQRFSA